MGKAGQPTKYTPEYCEVVIDLGKQGKSKAAMASHFNVSRQTIDNWAKDNPQFLEALSISMAHCQEWWETQGMTGMVTGGFNAAVWKKSMEARFRDDYTEKTEVEHSGNVVFNTVYEAKPGK